MTEDDITRRAIITLRESARSLRYSSWNNTANECESMADKLETRIDMVTFNCGCGDYGIDVSDHGPLYVFGAICPECGNHFGFDSSDDPEAATHD